MPSSQDYATIGTLYHAIRDGLERLVRSHRESAVFIGAPERQLGHELVNLPNLTRVRCLKTAKEAIDGIVTQGAGAPGYSRVALVRPAVRTLLRIIPDYV
jgi:hypothetical protein